MGDPRHKGFEMTAKPVKLADVAKAAGVSHGTASNVFSRPQIVREELRELAGLGCDIVTLGQYLRPSMKHLPIARYWAPEEFQALRAEALALGIPHVEAGPLVRSSYHADGQVEIIRALRAGRPAAPPVL